MAIFQWRSSNNNTAEPSTPPLPPPQPQQPPPQPSTPQAPSTPPSPIDSSLTSPRFLKQLSFVFLGASCILLSHLVTRRAIRRRNVRTIPKFFEPNTNPHEHFSPFMDAMQALNLATLNTFSVGGFLAAGTLWAFDVNGLEEMRMGLRGRLGYEAFENEEGLEEVAARRREELEGGRGSRER